MAQILIVDDDAQVRKLYRIVLEEAGHQVSVAADGAQAIKLYKEHPVDLMILDIIMPEKEGIETLREIRKDYPDLKVIAVSGGGQVDAESYLLLARKMGADRTFAKPVSRESLLQAVNELVDG